MRPLSTQRLYVQIKSCKLQWDQLLRKQLKGKVPTKIWISWLTWQWWSDTMATVDESQAFNKAWNHPMQNNEKNGKQSFAMNSTRYGRRCKRDLCPPIKGALRISGLLKLSATVCTKCTYRLRIFRELLSCCEGHHFLNLTPDGDSFWAFGWNSWCQASLSLWWHLERNAYGISPMNEKLGKRLHPWHCSSSEAIL